MRFIPIETVGAHIVRTRVCVAYDGVIYPDTARYVESWHNIPPYS